MSSKVVPSGNSTDNIMEVECFCCGMMEECTPAYIAEVRAEYRSRWICGLCSEAVKEQLARSDWTISVEEAMDRHISFIKSFKSSPNPPKGHLLFLMKHVMLRSLDSSPRSVPASPRGKKLSRSGSCFPSIGG